LPHYLIMEKISFKPFTENNLPYWYKWAKEDHVKNTWFLEGYEPVDIIMEKIEGNGYDFPFLIQAGETPIGYIVYCDLEAFRTKNPNTKAPCTSEPDGTFCIDLYIGEKDYLGKGYGTQIVKDFCRRLFQNPKVKRIVIDPSSDNKRAIRCYEKAGFRFLREEHDGVCVSTIMEMDKNM